MALIVSTPCFKKQLKRLAKKFPSLESEFPDLVQSLKIEPVQGVPLGKNCYKIRLAIASKGKGKSGGGRVITFVQILADTVYLLSIYDKSEKESVSDAELDELLIDAGSE